MATFHRYLPPAIVEIVAPPEFAKDEDLQERIVDDKMIRSYVEIMFFCCLVVGVTLLV